MKTEAAGDRQHMQPQTTPSSHLLVVGKNSIYYFLMLTEPPEDCDCLRQEVEDGDDFGNSL